jgi:hypothetical protein
MAVAGGVEIPSSQIFKGFLANWQNVAKNFLKLNIL